MPAPQSNPPPQPQPQSHSAPLSFFPTPLIPPTITSGHVLIIGGGVTALTTAWTLLDRGYKTTLLSKAWASTSSPQDRLTSQIAGALWEYPPAVCGLHTSPVSLAKSKDWSLTTYTILSLMAQDPVISAASGIRMKNSVFFFPFKIEDNGAAYGKMLELERSEVVQGFRRSADLIEQYGVNPNYGVIDAYTHLAPIVDTDAAMQYLMSLARSKGAQFVTETISGDLLEQEETLLSRFDAQVLVNCTGLSGKEVAGDESCYPVRGALLRVVNDGTRFGKIEDALCISAAVSPASASLPHGSASANKFHIETGTTEIVFILPRTPSILLLGGIAESHCSNLGLSPESPVIRRMRARCEAFLPCLKNAEFDEDPFVQGLRPFRAGGVRVEREVRRTGDNGGKCARIIHSYGHGGSGWSLSFGCAELVGKLVEEVLREMGEREGGVGKGGTNGGGKEGCRGSDDGAGGSGVYIAKL